MNSSLFTAAMIIALSGAQALAQSPPESGTVIIKAEEFTSLDDLDRDVEGSLGDLFRDHRRNGVNARQVQLGDLEAKVDAETSQDGSVEATTTTIGNSISAAYRGSSMTNARQRNDGSITAEIRTSRTQARESVELNAAAFANTLSVDGNATVVIDAKQRNAGQRVEARIHSDLFGEALYETNATAVGNSINASGHGSTLGADTEQRNDADIIAHNQTSGANGQDRVTASAMGNSISIVRN